MTPADDRARRAARRAAIKQHHPDRGGRAEDLDAALRALERTTGSQDVSGVTPIQRRDRSESPVTRMLRAAVARARRRLPRWVPGSRRYIQL
ncbi:hypothetical protein [Aeromicrobium fastidiosum]|uniref:J domain-containing protein n=1 Tax=Aeromicrobium fastidiosum TaxID=52699 RepID=A0A641AJ35_9ACTN|nr:hypothetical protein [Aeromicrobium fastidiosum]KAA1374887.1 hypothetical protein ESP62_016070 [Aeromicrobium fastidiosum]MBP2390547.1 ribosomal protein S21 [Aeromicrobium fastidiosum]